MPDSPYGIGYGLGTATSGLMSSYMQGQQYGLQRDQMRQEMELRKQQAATQQQLGQAQIEHVGKQNAAIDAETRDKVMAFARRKAADALHIGDWNTAAEAGVALQYHVDPASMSFVTADGKPTKTRSEAAGVAMRDVDGNPLFLDNNTINEWRFGGKFAQAKAVSQDRLEGVTLGHETRREIATETNATRERIGAGHDDARKHSADQHYKGVVESAAIRASAQRAIEGMRGGGGGRPSDLQSIAIAVARGMGHVDGKGNPVPTDTDYSTALSWKNEKDPSTLQGKVYTTMMENDPKFRKLDGQGKAEAVNGMLSGLFKFGTRRAQTPSGGGGGTTTPSQADLEYTAKKHGITVEEVKRRLGVK